MYQNDSHGETAQRHPFALSCISALAYFSLYYLVRTVIFEGAYFLFCISEGSSAAGSEKYLSASNMISFISALAVISLLVIIFLLRKKKLSDAFYLKKTPVSSLLICFFTGISLNFTTSFIISLLPEKLLESYGEASASLTYGNKIWYVLAAVIAAPVLEEIIFRAMVLSRFSRSLGNIPAIFISAAIFGLVHGHIVWSTYAFILGSLLGLVFVRTRSIIANTVMHLGFNLVSLTTYIRPTSTDSQELLDGIFDALNVISIPVSILLIVIFILKTRGAKKSPIGLE